jgi:hypothetical protein
LAGRIYKLSNPVGKKAKKSIQDLARESFEKIKEEPGEVVKSAGEQLTGTQTSESQVASEAYQVADEQRKQKVDRQKSQRLMSAHQKELEDIRKTELLREVQEKIQQGEAVSISDLAGISEEQKSNLRAQQDMVQENRKAQDMVKKSQGLQEPSTKRKRGIFQRAKKKVEQMKTRIETKFKSVG